MSEDRKSAFAVFVAQRRTLSRRAEPQCEHCRDTGVDVSDATGDAHGVTCSYCRTGALLLQSAI